MGGEFFLRLSTFIFCRRYMLGIKNLSKGIKDIKEIQEVLYSNAQLCKK
jgi:hypothetical protein